MNLLRMSASGALLILAVVLIRLAVLRVLSKRTFLILWALVLVRLLVPFPPLLPLPSLLPVEFTGAIKGTAAPMDTEARPTAIPTAGREPLPRPAQTAAPIESAVPVSPESVQPAVTAAPAVTARPQGAVSGEGSLTGPDYGLSPRMVLAGKAALLIWLLGAGITAAVFAILYLLSYRRFRRAAPLDGPAAEAWLAAHPAKRKLSLRILAWLSSPLTYGILRPVILLPEGLDPAEGETAYALEHEYVHARRLDALWKLLLTLALAVHWFNPCVWLAWFLANRDLELSCDEEVLRRFGMERRGDYARALLAMEEKRALLPPLHSGFGAGATKERILAIMKYKKATVLSVALAVVFVAVLAACALGGAGKPKETPEPTPAPMPTGTPVPTATPAPAPTAAPDGYTSFESGGYTLSVPAEYADKLTVETEKISDYWELLFTVTEKASYEAGQRLSPGNDDGLGWLFSIARVSEGELGKMMMWDMSGVQCFARTETGDYLLLVQPTDLRFVPTDASGKWQEQWDALDGWGRNSMTDRFLEDNSSLTPCRHGDSFVENALARVLYYDPAEYGEAGQTLIRYGDGEGADPMGTSQAREIARRMLWEYSMEGAAAAKDFPETGASVTLTDPLGIVVTFREDSDVVRVTYNGDTHQYFRLKSLLLHGNPIGSMACGWYFDAAATLSGETTSYRNGDFTLRLPAEYAYQLLVEAPAEGEALFNVYERDSRRRWDASSDHSGDTTDGWLFSILRMERDAWGSWISGGDSGVYMFAQDGVKYCYLCSYPIWRTFQPEDGKTVDRESEAYRQYSTLTAALRHFDIELYFTSDNNLAVSRFTGAQQYFLCFAIYGYDSCAIRQGPDGEPFDPRINDQALYYLKLLLWDVEYEALETAQEPAGEPIVLELEREYSQLSSRLLFWKDGDIAALENSGGRQYYVCKARGAEYGNRAYIWAATCLDMARIGVALPPTSGRTVGYTSQGLTLAIPEEYDELLIVDTEPLQQGALFRVMQRSSWENGQKAHPGEDRGDGLLFIVRKIDEAELIWELRANPTPVSLAGRDREGNYYLIGYPSDVRFVGEDPQIITPSDPGLPEWKALNHWAAGAGEAFCAANGDTLLPMEKAFCELEHVLAVILEDGAVEALPEFFRFVSPEGAVTEGSEVPEKFDYARRILLEGSTCYLPEDTPAPEGRPIRLEVSGSRGSSRFLFTFWPGSDVFREETFIDGRAEHGSRMVRMTLPKDGPNIGYLMVQWYGKAAEDVVHHVTAEVVGYGADTLCIKVTEPGDSGLDVGFEMYVSGPFFLSAEEDAQHVPATELPVGCTVEVAYRGEVVADGTYGPSIYVRMAEP